LGHLLLHDALVFEAPQPRTPAVVDPVLVLAQRRPPPSPGDRAGKGALAAATGPGDQESSWRLRHPPTVRSSTRSGRRRSRSGVAPRRRVGTCSSRSGQLAEALGDPAFELLVADEGSVVLPRPG